MTIPASPFTRDLMHEALAGYAPEQLAAWWVDLNGFHWPADFPLPEPDGWIDTPYQYTKRTLAKPLYRFLREHVSPEERSRAWWIRKLGRTAEEWAEWWDREGKEAPDGVG